MIQLPFIKNEVNINVFLRKFFSFFLVAIVMVSNLSAHEMWIEPVKYEVALGETIYAHEKVGQFFKGNQYAYLSSSYLELLLTVNNKTRDVNSRIGDLPAIHEKADEEGLTLLSAQTPISSVSYKTWEQFEGFIKSKGLDWALDEHKKRGLAKSNFTEAFSRYPKSLVKVGHGKGKDKLLGMPIEWLAETNPYTDQADSVSLRLLWQGKPFANTHVSVFNRFDGKLITSEHETDMEGRVKIPKANGGTFLINAVQMRKPSQEIADSSDAVWESLWASMTYQISLKK